MQRRLVITRYELGLENDVMDREVRLQQICRGTPHQFRILPAINRNVRCQVGIVTRDRPHMQVVNPVHSFNLSRRGMPCRRIATYRWNAFAMRS